MSKAEQRALEVYPLKIEGDSRGSYDLNLNERIIYQLGYVQAEKDLELTWEDIKDILNIYEEVIEMDSCEDIYGEVLKRFRDYKERKE